MLPENNGSHADLAECFLVSFAPTLASIINLSLESARVPSDMKHALVAPLLKKTGLDTNDTKKTGLDTNDTKKTGLDTNDTKKTGLDINDTKNTGLDTNDTKKTGLDANEIKNYRPISNLSFVSRLLERHVAIDLRRYIDENKLLDPFQSAYHPHHSTETALVRIHNDIIQALDHRKGVVLDLLVLTAAFDTMDHAMLLQQMHLIGIRGPALAWLTSYLSNRTMVIKIGDVPCLVNDSYVVVCRRDRFLGPCCLLYTACLLARYSPSITLSITRILTTRSYIRNSLVTNPAR